MHKVWSWPWDTASEGCCCLAFSCFNTKGLALAAGAAAAGEHMTGVHTWSSGTVQKDMSRIKQALLGSTV